MPIETLDQLLQEQMKDLYDAEKQLVKALPKMAEAASNQDLRQGFEDHLEQTREHVIRLEQAFEMLGAKAESKPCAAMKGLIEEGTESINEKAVPNLHDALLIASAQRVEHYEIAGYGNVIAAAEALGKDDVADLLQITLDEEKETDEKLTDIGEEILNRSANANTATRASGLRI